MSDCYWTVILNIIGLCQTVIGLCHTLDGLCPAVTGLSNCHLNCHRTVLNLSLDCHLNCHETVKLVTGLSFELSQDCVKLVTGLSFELSQDCVKLSLHCVTVIGLSFELSLGCVRLSLIPDVIFEKRFSELLYLTLRSELSCLTSLLCELAVSHFVFRTGPVVWSSGHFAVPHR